MQKEKTVTAKLRKGGKEFEILIHPEEAAAFKAGKSTSIQDALVLEEIYEDVKKGKKASEHEMQKIFGTDDPLEVAKIILKEGHVPMTEDMLKKESEQRRKQIIDLIHRNAVDPTTGKPHPPQRIDTAISDAKAKIDPHKPAEAQIHDVLREISAHLPIRFETRRLFIRIPVKHASRCLPILKQIATIASEKWEADGSLVATVEIPAGMQEQLELSLNNITKGDLELKLLGAK